MRWPGYKHLNPDPVSILYMSLNRESVYWTTRIGLAYFNKKTGYGPVYTNLFKE